MLPVILIMGMPASGKSSIAQGYQAQGYTVLNRDAAGGKVASLVPRLRELLQRGQPVVVDNLHLTAEGRWPFIEAANQAGVEIECHWMMTSFEDCQVNALNRMWDRYGMIFYTSAEIKAHPVAKKDPNTFPMAAMFALKKKLVGDKKKGVPSGRPTKDEGFSKIVRHDFHRHPSVGTNKAIILDYDGTLRHDAKMLGGKEHYPTQPTEVKLLPNRRETLQRYMDDGYLLLGVTTQSGIGKGVVTDEEVRRCLDLTNTLLGHDIHYLYCPHYNFPVQCYCRKPQAGLGVELIRDFDLDPAQCVFVGDATTDRTFAERCGFQFQWADDFFAAKED